MVIEEKNVRKVINIVHRLRLYKCQITLTTHKQKHAKTTQKNPEVQLIIIPECHLFQRLQVAGREIFIKILARTIRK